MNARQEIQVRVNDQPRVVEHGMTIAMLLETLAIGTANVAVERNEELVTRREHAETQLEHGDRVEIVTLVGGG